MAFTEIILLKTVGPGLGSYVDIYSDIDGYTTPFVTGVSVTELTTTGYTATNIPDGTSRIKFSSPDSVCGLQPYDGISLTSLKSCYLVTADTDSDWGSNFTVVNTGSTLIWVALNSSNAVIGKYVGNTPSFNFSASGQKKVAIYTTGNTMTGLTEFSPNGYDVTISTFDFNNATELTKLDLGQQFYLSNFSISGNTKLNYLKLLESPLTNINLSYNILLKDLYLNGSIALTSLNLLPLTELEHIEVPDSGILLLDFTNNTKIKYIDAGNTLSPSIGALTYVYGLDDKLYLEYLSLDQQDIDSISVTNCPNLTTAYLGNLSLNTLDITNSFTYAPISGVTKYLSINGTQTNINLNTSSNTYLESIYLRYINNPTSFNFSSNAYLKTLQIDDCYTLTGVTLPSTITGLTMTNNANLTSVPLSSLSNLVNLNLSTNNISNLSVSGNTNLLNMNVATNHITTTSLNTIVDNLITFNKSGNAFISTGQTPCPYVSSAKIAALDAIWTTVSMDICPTPTPTPTPSPTPGPTPTPTPTPGPPTFIYGYSYSFPGTTTKTKTASNMKIVVDSNTYSTSNLGPFTEITNDSASQTMSGYDVGVRNITVYRDLCKNSGTTVNLSSSSVQLLVNGISQGSNSFGTSSNLISCSGGTKTDSYTFTSVTINANNPIYVVWNDIES